MKNSLIRRQAAIDLVRDVCDAIMSGCESWYDPDTEDEVYKDIREVDAILKCNKEIRIALRNMPSAQPEVLAHGEGELSAQPEVLAHGEGELSAQPDWGKPVGDGRPLADSEIIPRLQDIKIQIGGSYAIDRAIEVLEGLRGGQDEIDNPDETN